MIVNLPVEFGNTTCASEPGKFCRFFGVGGMCGKYDICFLFPDDNSRTGFTILWAGEDGWLKRCDKCLEMFPPEE